MAKVGVAAAVVDRQEKGAGSLHLADDGHSRFAAGILNERADEIGLRELRETSKTSDTGSGPN